MNELTLACEQCGAPLSYDGKAASATCSFCGAVTIVERQPTPVVSLPTVAATPGMAQAVTGVSKAQLLVAVIAIGTVVVSTVTYSFLSAVSTPAGKQLVKKASKGRTAARVAQNPLATTIDKMALLYPDATRNVNAISSTLRIDLDDPTFEDITYVWDPSSPAHVTEVELSTARPAKARAAWVAKLGPVLGRQGAQTDSTKYEYSWCGVQTLVDESRVSVSVTSLRVLNVGLREAKINWQERLEQLWAVLKGALFNTAPLRVTPNIRERLGELPFNRLARLDPQTNVDNSLRTVETLLPNACPTSSSGVSYKAAVNHRWFSEVTLNWENERAAKLNGATFRPPNGKLANETAVARCVVQWLGSPVETEANHMEKIWYYQWERRGRLSVHIYDSYVWAEGPFSTAEWQKFIQVLDACGR